MKIANKIRLSLLTVSLTLTIIAGTIFYWVAKDDLQKSIYYNLVTTVASRCDHIETYLKMLETSVGQLSKSTILENLLKINDKEGPQQGESFAAAMKRLARTEEANPAIAEFLLLDKTGKVMASSSESSIGLDISTDSIFLGGQKETYIKDVYYSEIHKGPLMAISTPFLVSQTGELLGVLVARMRLNEINNIVAHKVGMGDTGEIHIVNKLGFMITTSRFKGDTALKQKVDIENIRQARLHKDKVHVFPEGKVVGVFSNYRGVQVLGAYEYIPQMQWTVLAEIDAKEALVPLAKIRLFFLLILFIVPIAAWLSGNFIAKVIAEPINRLRKGAEIIGSGNLDYKVSINTKDEVGQLSRAFDAMTENLKHSVASIENLNKEITERKRMEGALWESQERYRALVENTVLGVTVIDTNYKIIMVNSTFARLFRKPVSDIVGKYCFREYEKREEVCSHCPGRRAMASGKTEEVETQGVRDDGSRFYVRNRAVPFLGPDGVVKGFIEMVEDIDARKQMEEDLRKNEARYRSSIELTNQLAWTTDSNGEVVEDIPFWRKFTGLSYEETKGSGWTNALHPEDAERTRQAWVKAVKDKSAYEVEFRLRRFDGVYRDFLTRGMPVFKEDGSILEWVGVNIDITEHKKTEKEIANLARFPLENPFPVLRIAEDGTILYSNAKGLKVLAGWGTKVGSKVPERWCRLIKERFDTAKPWQEEEEEEEEEEGKNFSIMIAPIKEAGYANLYFRDITERKQAEEELRLAYKRLQQTQQELIQANKMAAMGQLAAGISHELNQPLTGIKGFTQAMLEELEKESPLRNDLNKIVEQVDRIDAIIKNVRFFARKSDFNMKELDINQVILNSLMLLSQQLKTHNIRVIHELGSGIPKIQGDPNQLQQAFLNFISNARDAILSLNRPEGGEIRIRTSLSQDKKQVEITFQDTGCGIPDENLQHIFSPFFSTKSPDRGMGLGLSITYRIIENHQGKIEFKTKASEGTIFRIVLPVKGT